MKKLNGPREKNNSSIHITCTNLLNPRPALIDTSKFRKTLDRSNALNRLSLWNTSSCLPGKPSTSWRSIVCFPLWWMRLRASRGSHGSAATRSPGPNAPNAPNASTAPNAASAWSGRSGRSRAPRLGRVAAGTTAAPSERSERSARGGGPPRETTWGPRAREPWVPAMAPRRVQATSHERWGRGKVCMLERMGKDEQKGKEPGSDSWLTEEKVAPWEAGLMGVQAYKRRRIWSSLSLVAADLDPLRLILDFSESKTTLGLHSEHRGQNELLLRFWMICLHYFALLLLPCQQRETRKAIANQWLFYHSDGAV